MIRAFSYNHPEIRVDEEIAQLSISLKNITLTEDVAKLRGIEGFAARTYFNGFRKLNLIEFSESLGYIKGNISEIKSLIEEVGKLLWNFQKSL